MFEIWVIKTGNVIIRSKKLKYIAYISIIMIYCLIPSVSKCDPLLNANQVSFVKGDKAVFSIGNSAPSSNDPMASEPVDVYIAFMVPGDNNLYYWPDFSSSPVPCLSNWVPEFVPATDFFSYVFPDTMPGGEYRLYSAFFKTGMFDAGSLVGSIAELKFDLNNEVVPDGPVLIVVPANGQKFTTTTPVFSISFVSPVDLESIKWHSKITVKNLVSDKTATLYTENGSILMQLITPDMIITHTISGNEEALFSLDTGDNGATLIMPVQPVDIEGQTFSLSKGGQYSFTIEFFDGAGLNDGTSLSNITIGPVEFFIE